MESYALVNNVSFWISNARYRDKEQDANAYEVRIGNDTTTTKEHNVLIEVNTVCDGFHDGKFSHFSSLSTKEYIKLQFHIS